MNRNDEMDIVRNYREAKYPKSQERILADLYLCEVSDIQEILIRNGVYRQNAKGKGGAAGSGIKRGKRKRKKVSA